MMKHVHEFIIICLAFLSICYTHEFALFSISPLGKLVAIMIILWYSQQNEIYGLIICAIVLLYYQMDFVEQLQYDIFYDIHRKWIIPKQIEGLQEFVKTNLSDKMYPAFLSFRDYSIMKYDETNDIYNAFIENTKTTKTELRNIFSSISSKSMDLLNGSLGGALYT